MDDGLFTLMLGAVPAVAAVYIIVEGLKRFGFVNGKSWFSAPRVAILAALGLTAVALVSEFVPATTPYISTAAPLIFGGLVAGLFYDLVGDLLVKRVQAAIAALFGAE